MPDFSAIRFTVLLLAVIPIAYYLYVGVKAYIIERADFLPTPYEASEGGHSALNAMLAVAEPVSWLLEGEGAQRAYYRPASNGVVIIYLHGSPGSGAGFHPMVSELGNQGFGALVLDLPGYGSSQGRRQWGDTYIKSVRLALDLLENRHKAEPDVILLLGYSQGASVATRAAAADRRIRGLVLMSGYTNLYDQLNHQFRWRLPGIGLFAVAAARTAGVDVGRMDSVAALNELKGTPVLVVSGTEDRAIPVSMARTLAETAEPGELWLVPGAGHGDLVQVAGSDFFERISRFALTVAERERRS